MENLIVNERLFKRGEIVNLLSERIILPEKIQRGEFPGRERRTKGFSFIKSDSVEPRTLSSSENPLKAGKEIISGLEKIGLDAKPFCFHEPGQNENLFVVNGSDFKWALVRIADYSKPEEIPSEMFRKLAVLKRNLIKHEGIWIAFPVESHSGEMIEREMKAMADKTENAIAAVGNAVSCIASLPFVFVSAVIEACNKDPVLVVQFNNLYLEFGRWE